MLLTIHEHTFDQSLITENSNILDLGCRDFKFTNHFKNKGCSVYSVDCDYLPTDDYHRIAIASDDGLCSLLKTTDPNATRILSNISGNTQMMTIDSFSELVGVKHWDLIKMDIEGEEFNILYQFNHPLADQVSVEFHAHCREEQTKETLDELLNYLSQFYDIHNSVWETRHGAGFNYWDVLLIAKQ